MDSDDAAGGAAEGEDDATGATLLRRLAHYDRRDRPAEGAPPEPPAADPISPELALVDPELAAAWRAQLPDPAPLPPLAPPVELTVPAPSPRPRRRRARRWLTLAAFGVVAFTLALLVDREPEPALGPRAAPSVSAPPEPTSTPVPTTTSPPTTAAATPTPPPRLERQTFAWVPSPGAAEYEFQLFRGATRIYRARVRATRLVLPRRWRAEGRSYSLEPGSYRWYVWPVSAATGELARAATVQARLTVE